MVAHIRVLIADDHTMVRQGLRSALECYPNIKVVGEAADGDEAIALAAKLKPTVIVMDINMSKMDGITATRFIKKQHPQIVVLGVSVEAKDYQVHAMQQAGAAEVLAKDKAVNDLYGAIQRAVPSFNRCSSRKRSRRPKSQKKSEKPASTETSPIEEEADH